MRILDCEGSKLKRDIRGLRTRVADTAPDWLLRLWWRMRAHGPSVIFRGLPIKQNKVVVCSFYGSGIGGNPRYVAEELARRIDGLDVVWLLRDVEVEPIESGGRAAKYGSMRGLYELATARLWIDDSRKKFGPAKRRGQFYLQTWHADMGLKYIEADAAPFLAESYKYYAQSDARQVDLMVAGSRWRRDLYKKSFWYGGEVLLSGTPRMDIFFGARGDRKAVLDHFDLGQETSVLLYAPTFRNEGCPVPDGEMLKKMGTRASERWGGEWIVLYRSHPNVGPSTSVPQGVVSASEYPDVQELIDVADVVVTDYSSLMFDAAIARKPCVLYTPDLHVYTASERPLYFRMEDLPFPQATDDTALFDLLRGFDEGEYLGRIDAFFRNVGSIEDGHASERIVDRLFLELQEENE